MVKLASENYRIKHLAFISNSIREVVILATSLLIKNAYD